MTELAVSSIPTLDELASDTLVHRFGDLFNPPGLTNFLGCVQVDNDLFAIRGLNFPPLATSDITTAALYVDRRFWHATGSPVSFTWRPDRVVRESSFRDLNLRTTTVLVPGQTAAVVHLEIHNTGPSRTVELRIGLRGSVTRHPDPWTAPLPPFELDNEVFVDAGRQALEFHSRRTGAVSLQGAWPRATLIAPDGLLFDIPMDAGDRTTISYVNVLADSVDEARRVYDSVVARAPEVIAEAEREWDEEIRAVFTPGNDRYSGSLPILETTDSEMRRLYHAGVLGVVYFKRDSPHSAIGRGYDTLMPRYWQTTTFLWDYSLSATVHAMLDPDVMRGYLQRWMGWDAHRHFGIEWMSGGPVGQWYSVNDFAMCKTMREYVRWTGDSAWLESSFTSASGARRPVSDYVVDYATGWERLKSASGLADYGGIDNLLECVSTYVHEVASLNAANVFNMRWAAEVLEGLGRGAEARDLSERAARLAGDIHQQLYSPGNGYWNARHPDGRLVAVRHCYDLITVLNVLHDDLPETTKAEMVRFFFEHLHSPTWMHALSPDDPDAMFSVRPDHQWNGAYTAWPALAVTGLYAIGESARAYEWLRGLAKSANQGPFSQAHFAESVVPADSGGARKASPELPYINDWACSSGGAWVNVFIESLFGVRTGAGGLTASPAFEGFDAGARLVGLPFQGALYNVDRHGAHPRR
ncbi:MAG TPA: hypothetical protein VNE62_12770 [Actinomycetota bacterium]|nr:hypothetical protein [Actinomycetota bacterium]